MTTKTFLEVFGLASLRDLPDLERLKTDGSLLGSQTADDLDIALNYDADLDDVEE